MSSSELDEEIVGRIVELGSANEPVDLEKAMDAFPQARNAWSDALLMRVIASSSERGSPRVPAASTPAVDGPGE